MAYFVQPLLAPASVDQVESDSVQVARSSPVVYSHRAVDRQLPDVGPELTLPDVGRQLGFQLVVGLHLAGDQNPDPLLDRLAVYCYPRVACREAAPDVGRRGQSRVVCSNREEQPFRVGD